ncbi:MAG: SH3 domain-containing protein [Burkholderiales bacterium]|nr:SH3 domain-containing protein [Burkholderiales bacterium]
MRHQCLWTSMFACLLAGELWEGSIAHAATNPSGLAKTQWRLVEFQTTEDARVTRRPDEPSRYVLRLDADGTATFWLNCTRSTGTWNAKPERMGPGRAAGQPISGTFRFDHFPERLEACATPGLEAAVLNHAPKVRSFTLKQGRLQLGLAADGGVYVWARDGTAAPSGTDQSAAAPAAQQAASAWQVTRRVNLREQPSTQSRVLALLPSGTRMQRGECQAAEGREWCKVTIPSGGEGFVAAEYLHPVQADARQ